MNRLIQGSFKERDYPLNSKPQDELIYDPDPGGSGEPRSEIRDSTVAGHLAPHLSLPSEWSGQSASYLNLCSQPLVSDLKSWAITIRKPPSSQRNTLPATSWDSWGLRWINSISGCLFNSQECPGKQIAIAKTTVDAKVWVEHFASSIRAGFPFPANLGTLLLLMTFLDLCPGLRDIVFGSR